jgi:hypothetical protein
MITLENTKGFWKIRCETENEESIMEAELMYYNTFNAKNSYLYINEKEISWEEMMNILEGNNFSYHFYPVKFFRSKK